MFSPILRPYRLVFFSLLAALATVLLSCNNNPGPQPDVVLVTVDTLRADHMSLYGYVRNTTPNIDAWFGEGTVYERAYATSSYTPPSVVSILTGLLPQNHGIRVFIQLVDPELKTAPRLLRESGYQTAAVVSNASLTREFTRLDNHFDYYDDFVDEKEALRDYYERRAQKTTDAALRWYNEKRDPEKPFFLWVHYIDPHGPYAPPESVTDFTHADSAPIDRNDMKRIPGYQFFPDITDALEYVDRYDEEIAYLDREVGRLLDAVKPAGERDDTLYVFSADHGETMNEHEKWFQHQHHVWESLIHVPLAIRGENFQKKRIDTPVSITDISPTILSVAGTRVPRGLDGVTLTKEPKDRPIFSESMGHFPPLGVYNGGQWRSVVDGDTKWHVFLRYPTAEVDLIRFYNLESDPSENRPRLRLSDEDTEMLETLLKLCRDDPDRGGIPTSYDRGVMLIAPKSDPELVEDAEETLRALGYIE